MGRIKLIIVFLVVVISLPCLNSCSKNTITVSVHKESFFLLKHYLDVLHSNKFEEAYAMLHPLMRQKVSFDEYVNSIKEAEKIDGTMVAAKIDGVLEHTEDEYAYRVTVINTKRNIKYNIVILKEPYDGKWYINGIKAIAYSERTKSKVEGAPGAKIISIP